MCRRTASRRVPAPTTRTSSLPRTCQTPCSSCRPIRPCRPSRSQQRPQPRFEPVCPPRTSASPDTRRRRNRATSPCRPLQPSTDKVRPAFNDVMSSCQVSCFAASSESIIASDYHNAHLSLPPPLDPLTSARRPDVHAQRRHLPPSMAAPAPLAAPVAAGLGLVPPMGPPSSASSLVSSYVSLVHAVVVSCVL